MYPGISSSIGQKTDLENYDMELASSDVELEEQALMKKIKEAPSVTLASGSITKGAYGYQFNESSSDFDLGSEKQSTLAELKKGLDKRNQAVRGVRLSKNGMLKKLSSGKYSESVRRKSEKKELFETFKKIPLIDKLKTKNTNISSQGNMSISKKTGTIDAKKVVSSRSLKKTNTKNDEEAYRSKFRTYGNSSRGLSSDQTKLVSYVKRNKNRIKAQKSEQIWETISKTYMLHGVPRLFDINSK